MNSCIFIFKLAEDPSQEYYQSKIKLLEVKANFIYSTKNKIFTENLNLLIWGNQINDVLKYYRKDDYVVIEGFLTTSFSLDANTLKTKGKKIEIIVLKIYLLFPIV
jgi:single-stranded DNA-binding protein